MFVCHEAVIVSFTSNFFAIKFHSKQGRVIERTKYIALDCGDTAPLNLIRKRVSTSNYCLSPSQDYHGIYERT